MIGYLPVDLQFQAKSGKTSATFIINAYLIERHQHFCREPRDTYSEAMGPSAWNANRHSYVQTISLGTSTPSPLEWGKCHFTEDPDPSQAIIASEEVYRSSVKVPLKLPEGLSLPPTFSYCLVSRIYSITMTLRFHVSGQWSRTTSLELIVPLQVY